MVDVPGQPKQLTVLPDGGIVDATIIALWTMGRRCGNDW